MNNKLKGKSKKRQIIEDQNKECNKVLRGKLQQEKLNLAQLDAYNRHKVLVNYHQLTNLKQSNSDVQVLIENHHFIWDDLDHIDPSKMTWGQRIAKKYYDRLFKEYCIADLSFYKQNKFGMRWRTEAEVIDGKGQFVCGAKKCSIGGEGMLTSWEVFFGYIEGNEKKHALVKLRLCQDCSNKLNYHHKHQQSDKKKHKNLNCVKSAQPGLINSSQVKDFTIKEEVLSEVDESENASSHYEDLIDQIWKRPVEEPKECQQTTFENEIDSYLSQIFT